MTVFCDTSVLVAACIRQHPHYERARPLLESIAGGKQVGVIFADWPQILPTALPRRKALSMNRVHDVWVRSSRR